MTAATLHARPLAPRGTAPGAGLHFFGTAALFVPTDLPDGSLPMVVLLHGATSHPEQALPYLRDQAEEAKFLLLAPKSRAITWDAIRTGFGPDVEALDTALTEVFERFGVDPARIAVAGFSDGASYALGLGLANGDLFSRVIAFSPGFVVPGPRHGRPPVFVSHGDADPVLPIERCSHRLVPALRATGYQVDFHEFSGGHEVRPDLATVAVSDL
ncbi:phospholipase/Carboxylesterase [Kribbella flavida DSM 17836]|uniref:Phospholipase/Carboxylesterase n=1 Tax=Kribbella flavida (strain DSM 17836 / JCM 10339 / NBRC 14399) TaxID=479435 RepID=D2Q0N6_KRIFD|nr:alpha/beta hydrolase-fold protein [Kribbella flavida]ADB33836.1 phospholipase/Carboxylesterase [Kribbella flavida DSM 17836]